MRRATHPVGLVPAPIAQNLAIWDRSLRVVLGAALCWLGWIVVAGPIALVLGVAGAAFLLMGLAGFCPLYGLFGLDTRENRPG